MNRPNQLFIPTFYHKILGNTTVYFLNHGDTVELFKTNREELDETWIWYDREINYHYNDYGFRMNNQIADIDPDNYVLFFGCSYTVGIGMPLEQTFPYKVAESLGCDYINTAVGFSSAQFVIYQLQHFLLNATQYPKAIYINWPNFHNTQQWIDNKCILFMPEYGDDSESYADMPLDIETINEYFTNSDLVIQNQHKCYNIASMLCEHYNIPVHQFSSIPNNIKYLDKVDFPIIAMDESTLPLDQRCRDVNNPLQREHHGSFMHDKIALDCLKFYITKVEQ